jgi:hypothetical protein
MDLQLLSPPPPNKCAGCHKNLPPKQFMVCCFCSLKYDLECANVSFGRYRVMETDTKNSWKCPECWSKEPKANNTNTPIKTTVCELTTDPDMNVTTRNKTKSSRYDNTLSTDDLSILGDTMTQLESPKTNKQAEITLESLSYLISEKLKENNKNIIKQLQNTIQEEINKTLLCLKQETNELNKQNMQRKYEIEELSNEIGKLKLEKERIQEEITDIRQKYFNMKGYDKIEDNTRKFVLYGIEEYLHEPEHSLHLRIIDIFREELQIDLLGYIEETRRIGKYQGKCRPLVVELISKRMVKYLIGKARNMRGTGVSMSPLLDEKARKERKLLRDEMLTARNKGLHAIIRNNELYIQGKKINLVNSNLETSTNTLKNNNFRNDRTTI